MIRRGTEERAARALAWSCVLVVVACTQQVEVAGSAPDASDMQVSAARRPSPRTATDGRESPSAAPIAALDGSEAEPELVAGAMERVASDAEARGTLRSAPSALRAAFVRGRQREGASDARYQVVQERGQLVARSPERRVTGRFTSDGFHVSSDEGPRGTLRTDALRCDDVRVPAGRGAFALGDATNRVERAIGRGELVATEWIESGPLGLEQGFDVSASRCAELVVELAVEGLRAERSGDGAIEDTVRLVGDEGALAYGELFAIDADGRSLPARFAVNGRTLELVVDTRDATWPVVVDPLVYTEDQIVTPPEGLGSDGAVGDEFGYSVAIDGDLAIVGAPRDDFAGLDRVGSAYVFARRSDAWVIETKLFADDGGTNHAFGHSVAISGDTALVAASGARCVYVFVRSGTTWSIQDRLVAPTDGLANDAFGQSVALSGHSALVGAPSWFEVGAVYVFVRTGETWGLQQTLPGDDDFGRSVALSGESALVGAPLTGSWNGAAYVFLRTGTTWTRQATLVPDVGITQRFGSSVALDRETALVGAPFDGDGAAYVFERSGIAWARQARLDHGPNRLFGFAVAVSGTAALVTSRRSGDWGAAYVFERVGSEWTFREELSIGAEVRGFGVSAALSGSTALVGANRDDAGAVGDVGSAHLFERRGATWGAQTKLSPGEGANGDSFAASVAISEDTAVVGSSGAAYVFVRRVSTWEQQAKLEGERSFGFRVAVSGDTALVSTRWTQIVGVFVRSGTSWAHQATLAADDVPESYFGHSVAIDGDVAIVGAPREDRSALQAGAAYVFVRSGTAWSREAKLVGEDVGAHQFGENVAISGDTAVVGVYPTFPSLAEPSPYVFVRSGTAWSLQARLVRPAGELDGFGNAVALSGDTALVGAYRDEAGRGAAYVFSRTDASWSLAAKLVARDGSAIDELGTSLALLGDVALLGAHGRASRGAAFVFVRDGATWQQALEITDVDGRPGDLFGLSVALSHRTTLIGAPNRVGAPPHGNRGGAAYFGTLSSSDGAVCLDSDSCNSGFCVDGVCCDTACGEGATDDCQACSIAAGSAVDGVCGATTGNTCDDGLACTTLDACDAGACEGALVCDDATSCTEASGTFVCGVCPAGSYSVDGTGATECVPCATGAWSGVGATACVPWTVCGVGSRVVSVASPTSDRGCVPCEAGTFSSTMNASVCVAWSDCPAGTFVREAGSASSDRTCDACVAGFSSTTNAGSCAAWTECGVGEFSSSAPTSTRDRECTACSRCDEDEVEVSPCAEATDTECARVDDAGVPILDGGLDDGGLVDGSIDGSPDASDGGVSGGGGCGCHTSAPAGSAFGLLLGVGWMLFGRRRRRADRHEVTGGAITINAASGTRRAPRSTQHQVRDEHHDQRSIRTRRAPRSTQQQVRDERRDREHDRQHDREDLRD